MSCWCEVSPCGSMSTMWDASMLLCTACTVMFIAVLKLEAVNVTQVFLGDPVLGAKADLRCSLTFSPTLRPKSKFKSQGKWSAVNTKGNPSLKLSVLRCLWCCIGAWQSNFRRYMAGMCDEWHPYCTSERKGQALGQFVLGAWGLKFGTDTVSKEVSKQSICKAFFLMQSY